MVSREELIEASGPKSVEEKNLSSTFAMVRRRRALGEANGGITIETVRARLLLHRAVRDITVESPELIYTRHTRSQILIEESSETDALPSAVAQSSALDVSPETSPAQVAVTTSNARSDWQLGKLTRWPFVLTIVAVVAALAAGAGLVRRASLRDDASASDRRGAAAVNAAGVRTLPCCLQKVAGRD